MFLNIKIISQAEFRVLTKAHLLIGFLLVKNIYKETYKITAKRCYIN